MGVAAMPTIGWLSRMAPVEPKKRASPKVKMPPSDAGEPVAGTVRCAALSRWPSRAAHAS